MPGRGAPENNLGPGARNTLNAGRANDQNIHRLAVDTLTRNYTRRRERSDRSRPSVRVTVADRKLAAKISQTGLSSEFPGRVKKSRLSYAFSRGRHTS